MLDGVGYPTEETLNKIRNWPVNDFKGLAMLLIELWQYQDYIYFDNDVLHVSTGGWSGHEEIIDAIPNIWKMNFETSWRTGGHYTFQSK